VQSLFNGGSAGKCLPSLPPSCVNPPPGLVSWWPGNGSGGDLAGGNSGTVRGNATYAGGQVGQAFSFDGDGDGLVVGNPVNLQMQNFTIEAWIRRANSTKASLGPYGSGAIFAYSTGGYGFAIVDDGRLVLTKEWVSGVDSTLA